MVEWTVEYWPYVIAVLLAISELLAVTPWFKGNGLLDTVIQALKKAKTKNG